MRMPRYVDHLISIVVALQGMGELAGGEGDVGVGIVCVYIYIYIII